ncbi:MAG: recombinase family protein [Pseudomonadota bacterium]
MEADTVKALYDLYREHGAIGTAKERADRMGLKSRLRMRRAERVSCGTPFDRGHIHHILTNPIYAGRIRHKGQVFEGQHPAIIEPEIWDRVQEKLKALAAKKRGARRKTTPPLLAGQLFDETGDRLTPSHSRKYGKRLRYYISHRLVKDRSRKHPDAWRLPAEQLESLIADLIGRSLTRKDAFAGLVQDATAAEIADIQSQLQSVQTKSKRIALVERVDIQPGRIGVSINRNHIADLFGLDAERIDPKGMQLDAPFQVRCRGLELRLHLSNTPPEIDRTLVQNVIKAQRWLSMILDGKSFAEIAVAENPSKGRVQDVVDLAMVDSHLLDAISRGEQPYELTSDYLVEKGVLAIWTQQRSEYAKL